MKGEMYEWAETAKKARETIQKQDATIRALQRKTLSGRLFNALKAIFGVELRT